MEHPWQAGGGGRVHLPPLDNIETQRTILARIFIYKMFINALNQTHHAHNICKFFCIKL